MVWKANGSRAISDNDAQHSLPSNYNILPHHINVIVAPYTYGAWGTVTAEPQPEPEYLTDVVSAPLLFYYSPSTTFFACIRAGNFVLARVSLEKV